jgi:hypothetical protein
MWKKKFKKNLSKIKNIYCLLPVFNDWESFSILINNIETLQKLHSEKYLFSIIAVNDGSNEELDEDIFSHEINYTILNLKINIGHQRAIAVGLQYIYNEVDDLDYVIVMDSDGDDNPDDISILLEKSIQAPSKIIFAQRNKRQESSLFKLGYFFYKYLFYFLTGQKINFGNFSLIPKKLLGRVVNQSNIWNHYSGGILQSKIPYDKVLINRGKRYKGVSKMNFDSLIIHGLSSIAVYFDFLSLRILRYSLYGILICSISVSYILYQKFFTEEAIPGWASSLILIISGIILQLFSVTLIVLLLQLSSRKNISAPDSKIYLEFIESTKNY